MNSTACAKLEAFFKTQLRTEFVYSGRSSIRMSRNEMALTGGRKRFFHLIHRFFMILYDPSRVSPLFSRLQPS